MKFHFYLLIFSLFFISLVSVGQDLIPFENRGTGLWGFRNQKTGDIVLETKYDEVDGFNQGITSVQICEKNGDSSTNKEFLLTHHLKS